MPLSKVTSNVTQFPGAFTSMQVFTSSGTWTKPSGLVRVKVTVVGGGGGGGAAATTSAGTSSGGSGGGGGGASIKVIAASALGGTETVTVGTGGAGGSTSPSNGSAGGTSSFGSHCSATGGSAGFWGAAANIFLNATGSYADGGIGSSGNVNFAGGASEDGIRWGQYSIGGKGGDSYLGAGGKSPYFAASNVGRNFGGGGSGAGNSENGAAKAGASGADGIVIVEEFF